MKRHQLALFWGFVNLLPLDSTVTYIAEFFTMGKAEFKGVRNEVFSRDAINAVLLIDGKFLDECKCHFCTCR